jgi:hypothetical protein
LPTLARTLVCLVEVTALVFTVNVAEICPSGTRTCASTCTAGSLLRRSTSCPPASAGAFSVTVPANVPPPATLTDDNDTEAMHGVRTRLSTPLVPPHAPVAITVAGAAIVARPVAIGNAADSCPPGTTTRGPTVTLGCVEESVTGVPSGGAGSVRFTRPVRPLPLTIPGNENPMPSTHGAPASKLPLIVLPSIEPLITIRLGTVAVVRLTGTVALYCPAGITTDPGTDTAASLEASATVTPPAGAAHATLVVTEKAPSTERVTSVRARQAPESAAPSRGARSTCTRFDATPLAMTRN